MPSWEVRATGFDCTSGYVVEREIGWYEQRGDADDADAVIRLMRAMDAAHKALEEALDAAEKALEEAHGGE